MPAVHSKCSDDEESSGILRSGNQEEDENDTSVDASDMETEFEDEEGDDEINIASYQCYEQYKEFENYDEACRG